MMWYTRDDDGDRSLWAEEPSKDVMGAWSVDGSATFLIAGDWFGGSELIDDIMGKGFHGLRKGQKKEISLHWSYV